MIHSRLSSWSVSRSIQRITLGLALFALLPLSALAAEGEARLLRYPSIHEDFVVFVYGGDLWRVPVEGGRAFRLTSHEGTELTPKISPDGEWVAFSGEYSGSRQVYVMPATGGAPKQLTFYNDVGNMPPRGGFDYWIQGWCPDGKILVRMNRTPWGQRPGLYYLVDPAGGLEERLPIQVGGSASCSPDGTSLAFTYFDREFRTWKRHMGGRNQDIWTFDLAGMASERLTDWAGSDNFPMWHGDTIYFTSDREHTLNIFAYDKATSTIRKVTDFDEYDVLWPSLGPNAIVFMNGGWLYRLDLATEEVGKIPVTIASGLPSTLPRWEDVSDNIDVADVSPGGSRAVFEARGDLFTVPAKDGATRNLSNTQGVRESAPRWSPDGRSIAYYSDVSGEMELYVREQGATAEPRQLTQGSSEWRYPAEWSPDSKKLAFSDSDRQLNVIDVASGAVTLADTDSLGFIDTYRWSPDSKWVAFEKAHPDTRLPGLAVFSLASGDVQFLSDGLTVDFAPAWGPGGKYLFFLSNRDYNLTFSDFEFNYIYDNSTRVFAVALDPEADALFPLKSDEVEIEEEGDSAEKENGNGDDDAKSTPDVEVTLEGVAARTLAVPGVTAGNYGNLSAVEGALLYLEIPDDGPSSLMRFDIEEREEKEVVSGVADYRLAARGEKVLYQAGDKWSIADAKPDSKGDELDLSDLRMRLDPQAEWAQMFDEDWRIGRDWFYDSEMHGVGWDQMKERYGALVPYVTTRGDLDFIFGEMVGELEAGHTYVQSGEDPGVDRVEGGMLGAEFEADSSGRFRIAKIFAGENWDDSYRSPLTELGVNVSVGDFLLAVDGVELTTEDNPYRLLEGKGDRQLVLTVNSQPSMAGARTETVRTITSERNLRYLDWVMSRAALVNKLSGGRIGYIHLPNTAVEGNRMLQKLFYSQSQKDGLIIDDRYNGGGFIPDRMIEMLSRTTLSFWTRRGVDAFSTPGFAHDGPKVMLINGYAASGGDALPYYFRKRGLGQVIGTTTWGGLIGLSGNPMLVDGGGVLYPTFRLFDTEGQWAVENEGVAPDIEVWDLPEVIAQGGDPSIEKAVEVLLQELESYTGDPESPTPPDMGGD
ncbi:MAG: acetyl-CoA synthetase [Bacteroidia bacterium]|nr:acetyl-CoA synthetase [Bacteroidia bacterium]